MISTFQDYIQGSAVAPTTTTTTTTTTKTTITTTTTFKTPPTKQKCGTHSFIETSNKEAKVLLPTISVIIYYIINLDMLTNSFQTHYLYPSNC